MPDHGGYKRTLVISDLHGCYAEFNELLDVACYDPECDKLILLGDYSDRGPQSREVIARVKALVEEHGVIALRGNHDQMFVDALLQHKDSSFLRNGGFHTIRSYCELDWDEYDFDYDRYIEAKSFILDQYKPHIDFLQTLPLYYEDARHIYVHAGVDPSFGEKWKEQPERSFIWIRDAFYKHPVQAGKTVLFGHTPVMAMHESADIWFGGDKIGMDGGCCFGGQLNCLEIAEDGSYRSYVVKSRRSGG
ncbi:metallophosphoesterase family protein [Paenibacillus ginsengarvi]|uniref:Serine/threonine protein phosphatase n=1 Tax=Paenibacillus ginsengarvi TaxID=400777 RepID=A0A3B0BCZ0_9BACL|nr:metallophosphoesterase family protein [Paenibacillus ginsengarvi]RKN70640.1 serine/threonine protein phosphatase [Paenibacillus ginsengarvi]